MMDLQVITECYIDTKLCKILVPPKARYNHQKGCPNVAKVMKRLGKEFALGIVDKDKRELEYFGEFELLTEIPDNLQLLKHRNGNQYLIFIRPVMEKWIISCAKASKISLTDFNLPDDFTQLMKITKTSKSENDDPYSANFGKLFSEFKRKKSSLTVTLSFWIDYLKNNPYDADPIFLRAETGRILGEGE